MTPRTPGRDPEATQTAPDDTTEEVHQEPEGTSEPDARTPPSASELEDRWRRALADLDNLRKRHGREVAAARAAERERVAAAFLPVLDNLDLALHHAQADPGAIVDGVRTVREQAAAILEGLGYPRQDDAGVPFDPARHEVIGVVAPRDDQPAGSVADVVRPGYGSPERQLRPAAVTVTGTAEG